MPSSRHSADTDVSRCAIAAWASRTVATCALQGLRPVAAGLSVGLVVSLATAWFSEALLFEVAPLDLRRARGSRRRRPRTRGGRLSRAGGPCLASPAGPDVERGLNLSGWLGKPRGRSRESATAADARRRGPASRSVHRRKPADSVDALDAFPRPSSSIKAPVLRGCVRAPFRAPRAGRGVRPPAAVARFPGAAELQREISVQSDTRALLVNHVACP